VSWVVVHASPVQPLTPHPHPSVPPLCLSVDCSELCSLCLFRQVFYIMKPQKIRTMGKYERVSPFLFSAYRLHLLFCQFLLYSLSTPVFQTEHTFAILQDCTPTWKSPLDLDAFMFFYNPVITAMDPHCHLLCRLSFFVNDICQRPFLCLRSSRRSVSFVTIVSLTHICYSKLHYHTVFF